MRVGARPKRATPGCILTYLGVVVPPGAGVFLHEVDSPGQEEPHQQHGQAGHSQDHPEWHPGGGGGGGGTSIT